MDVITATIEGLLLGRPLDREGWLHLAGRLSNRPRAAEEDAVLAMAQIATAEDTRTLGAIIETIPAINKPARAIGRAMITHRTVDTTDPSTLNRLVFALYHLLPYLRERSHMHPALVRLADLQAHAIELGGDSLDPLASSMFTNVANSLSMTVDDSSYLDAAFGLADRIRTFPAVEAREKKVGRYMTISNLVTTCKQLAKHRSSEAERYLLCGVELASSLCNSRNDLLQASQDPNLTQALVVQALKNLIFMCVELVRVSSAQSSQHAAAWRYASQLRDLAEKHADPDLRREAATAEDFLLERLGPLPGSPPAEDKPPLGTAEALLDRMNAICRASWVAAQQALQLPPGADRHRAIVEHVESLYGELGKRLFPVVHEVGVNRHVTRLLLALGAVASGRLWPLAFRAVEACILRVPLPEEGESHWHMIERAQELPSHDFFDLGSNYAGLVCALATFSDALSFDDELAGMLQPVLREQNRALLEQVLPAAQPVRVRGRRLSKLDDLAAIMMLVQTMGGHREPEPTPAQPPAQESEPVQACPCGSGKPFIRCHGAEE